MSTYLESTAISFCLPCGKADDAFAAAVVSLEPIMKKYGGHVLHDFEQIKTIGGMFEFFGFGPDLNYPYLSSKMWHQREFLAAIAPFVMDGSEIIYTADGEPYKWLFDDGKLRCQYAEWRDR
jgi:hypothetical protein